METKTMTEGKTSTESIGVTEMQTKEQTLNELWGNNQVTLSRRQVEGILQAFKDEDLKKEECLIFEDKGFYKYRILGNQKDSKRVPFEKRRKTKLVEEAK